MLDHSPQIRYYLICMGVNACPNVVDSMTLQNGIHFGKSMTMENMIPVKHNKDNDYLKFQELYIIYLN